MTTYAELKNNLRSDSVQKLYLLLGPEEYLARELTARIVELALGDGMRDFNFAELDTLVADPPALFQELNANPRQAGCAHPRRVRAADAGPGCASRIGGEPARFSYANRNCGTHGPAKKPV